MPQTINKAAARQLIDNLRNDTIELEPDILRVPVDHFVNPDRAAAEIALLRTVPIVVAHHGELPKPGSFITRDVLGTSIIIVRREDGSVGAYLNMCRHRGGKVEPEAAGAKRLFTCQYHGWSYNRDAGDLRHVPYGEDFGEFDRSCYSLVPVQVEQRHGLIWADFSNQTDRSVADFLGTEIENQVGLFDLDNSQLFLEKKIELNVNWKLVMDGACDILHLKFLHPHGVGKLLVTGRSVFLKFGRHGQSFTPRKRMEELAKSDDAEVDAMWKYVGSNIRIYPNAMWIASPDHVEFWTVWPSTDPTKCVVDIRFLVRPEILDEAMGERITRSWEILEEAATNEDFPMEVSIQENAVANPDAFFTYGRNETSIRHLHESLEADLAAVGQPVTIRRS